MDTVANSTSADMLPEDNKIEQIALFKNKNYKRHWASTALFSLGDYFTLIAIPWLVLMLTKDPAVLGIVMALESLPRAVLMLVSGSFADRYTPRKVLLYSRSLFMITLLLLALMLFSGDMQINKLYVFAFFFGSLSAFAIPAATSLLPQLVEKSQIEQGNGALMGTQQLVQLFTPVLAGMMIWGVSSAVPSSSINDFSQLAYAFLVSAGAVFVAIVMLVKIKLTDDNCDDTKSDVRLVDGFRYLWRDKGLRIVTLYMSFITFFAVGPLLTVIPQFADQRLDNGALSYGLLFTANGFGALLGFAASGLLAKPKPHRLGFFLFTADLIAGLCILGFAYSYSLTMAAPALIIMGMANSFAIVLCMSWIQRRIPSTLSGRVLGLVMFATMGLTPISMALSGFFIASYSLTILLLVSGVAIVSLSLLGLVIPLINQFGVHPIPELSAS